MSRPLTPDELRAQAAAWRAEADEIERTARVEAAGRRFQADEFERAAKLGLTITADYAKVRLVSQMDIVAEMARSRSVGRPIRGKHALQVALKRSGMTMTELARVLGVPRTNVNSWTRQSIPAAQAKRIEQLLGVPATVKSWPAGIRQ